MTSMTNPSMPDPTYIALSNRHTLITGKDLNLQNKAAAA